MPRYDLLDTQNFQIYQLALGPGTPPRYELKTQAGQLLPLRGFRLEYDEPRGIHRCHLESGGRTLATQVISLTLPRIGDW